MMDAEELDLVRTSVRHLLAEDDAASLPGKLLAFGWAELLATDTAAAVTVLAEEQGRARAATPSLDLVLLHAAGLPVDATTAVVLPPLRRGATVADDGDAVDGLVLAGVRRASQLVVPTAAGLVTVPAPALALALVGGADPDLGLQRATGRAEGALVADAAAWQAALAAGRRALASELVGLAEEMLASTVAYVLERHQFGRPIGSFQAVKHRLADVRVAITAARSGIAAAWEEADPTAAMAAKCLAAHAHRLAATHCQQVQGGIAFTTEHGFHRWIQRGHLVDGLLGAAHDLVPQLGRILIDAGAVPRRPILNP